VLARVDLSRHDDVAVLRERSLKGRGQFAHSCVSLNGYARTGLSLRVETPVLRVSARRVNRGKQKSPLGETPLARWSSSFVPTI
jgi:hypothetical protein